jgi:hypothetical protein
MGTDTSRLVITALVLRITAKAYTADTAHRRAPASMTTVMHAVLRRFALILWLLVLIAVLAAIDDTANTMQVDPSPVCTSYCRC